MGILDDIRVLDLGHHVAAPFASQLLADYGAEVIRIERPGGDDDRRFGYLTPTGDSYAFLDRGRNKKGITLKLDSESGRKILWDLVRVSDVVIEGFAPPSIKEKLGVDYSTLSKVNPRIIVVSVSCFGLDGPYMNRVGFDAVGQALSGAMSITGFPDKPPVRSGVAWVDYSTAALGALSAVLALYERQKSNKGQLIDLALLDVACCAMSLHGVYNENKLQGVERPRLGSGSMYAYGGNFEAKDGLVYIAIVRNSIWRRFARAMGREDLIDDPRFNSDWDRFENRELLDQMLKEFVATKTIDELIALLGEGVPCVPVARVGDVANNPQVKAREALIEMGFPELQETAFVHGLLMKFSRTPGEIRYRAPLLGEHNEEVYHSLLNYSPEKISRLKQESVI